MNFFVKDTLRFCRQRDAVDRWVRELEDQGHSVLRLIYEDDLQSDSKFRLRATMNRIFDFLAVDRHLLPPVHLGDNGKLPLVRSPLSAKSLSERVSNWQSLLKAIDGAHRQACVANNYGCCSDWMSTIKLH
jgi:hypothetical protein